jgi:hypothetical protein
MLQCFVVNRWVQSGHIFLIHPWPETLPFGSKDHKSFREDAQVLGDVIIVLHYKSCSKWQPLTYYMFCTTCLCYAEMFERFPDSSSCYCNSCHKIMLCLHWSLTHQALHIPPEKDIQWSQVRGARWPSYWFQHDGALPHCTNVFREYLD